MQISNSIARSLDLASQAKRAVTTATGASQASGSTTSPNSTSNDAALRDVLSRYDVSAITPTQFSEMLQSLRKTNAISDSQFQELSAVRTEMEAQGVKPDEKVDLIQFCTKQLKSARENGSNSTETATKERQLQWMQKAAQLQSTPAPKGLNSLV
jgi:hypothetical protein